MSAIDVEETSIVKGEGTVNNPLGITKEGPVKVAAIVMTSPSSSLKFEAKGILKLLPWTREIASGTMTTLGAALVTFRVKLAVIFDGKSSETVNVIT